MGAVAAYLRQRAAEDIRRMDSHTRMCLALELGDDDRARYCAVNGVDPDHR